MFNKKEQYTNDTSSIAINIPESAIELQKELIHPESEWSDMDMDLVVSNLGPEDLYRVRENLEIAGHCAFLGLKKANSFFVRNSSILLNSARSKFGFERKMSATQIVQQQKEIGQSEKKGGN